MALNAFQILRSESGERIGSIHVWQHRFLIQDSGPIAFYLPIPEKDVLLAMAKLRSPTGAVWEFEPKSIAWSPGATFRFFAKRVD